MSVSKTEQEQTFLTTLQSAASFRINGSQLEISRRPARSSSARTAVIVGAATAVSGAVACSQQQKAAAKQAQATAAQQQALAEQQAAAEAAAQAAAEAVAPAAGLTDDALAQLQKLGELHQAGILSDKEFAATRAKLLGL